MTNRHATIAASMLYEHRLDNLGKAFAQRNLYPVVVKGQAVVDLAYPRGEVRLSADVDILAGNDQTAIRNVLLELGYRQKPARSRHFPFEEMAFNHTGRDFPTLVEVHQVLDKVLLRPIPYAEIIARSKRTNRIGFRYPTIEDLLLLVILHASADVYFDAARIERDLYFLLKAEGVDMKVVRQRAHEWQLMTALSRLMTKKYPRNKNSSSGVRPLNAWSFFAGQFGWHDSAATVLRGLAYYLRARLYDKIVRW